MEVVYRDRRHFRWNWSHPHPPTGGSNCAPSMHPWVQQQWPIMAHLVWWFVYHFTCSKSPIVDNSSSFKKIHCLANLKVRKKPDTLNWHRLWTLPVLKWSLKKETFPCPLCSARSILVGATGTLVPCFSFPMCKTTVSNFVILLGRMWISMPMIIIIGMTNSLPHHSRPIPKANQPTMRTICCNDCCCSHDRVVLLAVATGEFSVPLYLSFLDRKITRFFCVPLNNIIPEKEHSWKIHDEWDFE